MANKGRSATLDPIARMPDLMKRVSFVESLIGNAPSVWAPDVEIGYYEGEKPNPVEHPMKSKNNSGHFRYY